MCTCTIDIASESLNLSYNCVYFFSRAGPPNSLSRRASGGSPRPRIARAARGFLYAAVIAVRLAMAAAGMGPRPPLATSTRGRPHQAAPACRSNKYSPIAVQRSRSSATGPQHRGSCGTADPPGCMGAPSQPQTGVLGQRKGDVPEQAPGKGCLQLSRRCAVAAMPCVGARHWPGGVDIDLHGHGTLT